MQNARLTVLLAAASALSLPYTLQLAGQGAFYAKAGVPACLATARDELRRQKIVVERGCARDGGRLSEGPVVETLVQGVLCTAVQPMTCALPLSTPGGPAPLVAPVPDDAPRS